MGERLSPDESEITEIENEIKGLLAGSGSNMADAVRRFNERYNVNDLPQVFGRQIKNGTIPFWKVRRIADLYGYKIKFDKK